MQLKYKKETLTLNSSRLSERVVTKKLKSTLNDAKKSKMRKTKGKDIRYHSDTEDIIDLPDNKLNKDIKTKKNADLKKQVKLLEKDIADKENVTKLLITENDDLKTQLQQLSEKVEHIRRQNNSESEHLQKQHKEVCVKYERLLLDHSTEDKDEQDQLSVIKDEHAKLKVENDWLIKEINKFKQRGFKGEDSIMRMVDEIEVMRDSEKLNYEQDIKSLTETVHYLETQKEDLMKHIKSMKPKVDTLEVEINNKNEVIQKQTKELEELNSQAHETASAHTQEIKEIKEEIESIQESNRNVINLYEYQTEAFRQRVAKEIEYLQNSSQNSDLKHDSDEYSTLLRDLAQRDAVCKNLKEENKDLKLQISKMKVKQKEVRVQPLQDTKSLKIKSSSKQDKKAKTIEIDDSIIGYTNQEYQQILKQITLLEAENIKLSSK